MRRADTPDTWGRQARPAGGLLALAVLAAGAYAAHAWLADSPYWMELGHRPLVVALRTAALALDWSQGVKLAVILGSSLWVLRTDAPRPSCELEAPSLHKVSPVPVAFRLETAR